MHLPYGMHGKLDMSETLHSSRGQASYHFQLSISMGALLFYL